MSPPTHRPEQRTLTSRSPLQRPRDMRIFAKDDHTGEIVELEEDDDTRTLFALVRYSNSQPFPQSNSKRDQALLDKVITGFRMSFPGHTPLLPVSAKGVAERPEQDMEDNDDVEERESSAARPKSVPSRQQTTNSQTVFKGRSVETDHGEMALGVESGLDAVDEGQADQDGEQQDDFESSLAHEIADTTTLQVDDLEEEDEVADSDQRSEHRERHTSDSIDVDEDAGSNTSVQPDDTDQPPTKKRRRSRGHGWTRRKRRSYLLEDIRDENETQYLVGWKDAEATWEPKCNVNRAAVEAWEEIKKKRR